MDELTQQRKDMQKLLKILAEIDDKINTQTQLYIKFLFVSK